MQISLGQDWIFNGSHYDNEKRHETKWKQAVTLLHLTSKTYKLLH